jgi:hypothetical protein
MRHPRIVGFPARSDWYGNTAEKAHIIRDAREVCPGPLLYVDVDAFVHSNCSKYFEQLAAAGADFGAHYFAGPAGGHDRSKVSAFCPGCNAPVRLAATSCPACGAEPISPVGWRLLSGTLFFGDTPGARRLCDAWVAKNDQLAAQGIREGGGQKNLWRVVTEMEGELKIQKIPGRYCYVGDKPWAYPPNEPMVIEHTIASRENRDGTRVNAWRRQRIAELRSIVGL